MYAAPPEIGTRVFTRLPQHLHFQGEPNEWVRATRPGQRLHSFLEGPSFDRDGNLYCVDVPHGRVFRISPAGEWTVALAYDGEPNGLKIHRDGRIFIADYKRGIMLLDPASGKVTPLLETVRSEGFKGVNDLVFGNNGDLYFTDQGQTGLHDPTGRVYRYTAAGRLELLVSTVPSPNGLVLNRRETQLYVGVTRGNAVWRLPLFGDGGVSKVGLFIQLSGGLAGPDGMALDVEDGLIVAQPGMTVWRFDRVGRPTHHVEPQGECFVTNAAFGGPGGTSLFMTDSGRGLILKAEMPVAGKPMFSHA